MANPQGYHGLDGALGTLRIPLKFSVTTGGAVASVLSGGEYIASVVKGTTGFVVTFLEPWYAYLGNSLSIMPAAYAAARACDIRLVDDSVDDTTTPTLTFLTTKGSDGTAVDMTTGDIISGDIVLQFTNPNG